MQTKNGILLIEDENDYSETLKRELDTNSITKDVEVDIWTPSEKDDDIFEVFEKKTQTKPTLVATDYNLSNSGAIGLKGSIIKEWCHIKQIPVIEYSRDIKLEFRSKFDLFNFHVSKNNSNLSAYIANVYDGFQKLSISIDHLISLNNLSFTNILYHIFEQNCQEYEMSQYAEDLYRYIPDLFEYFDYDNNGSLRFHEERVNKSLIKRILIYITGHIIVNSVMRYPGPILSDKSLCAYFAIHFDEANTLHNVFKDAQYDGPFDLLGRFYWKSKVDEVIEKLVQPIPDDQEFSNIICMNRTALEREIKKELKRHECSRKNCEGERGGYFCPYSEKIVCEKEFCSTSRSSWIPHGANICRIDKDLYSKLSPLMVD